MPGLFGIISMDGTAHDGSLSSLFDAMSGRLRHYPEERLETWADPQGRVRLGRIGLPHVHPVPFPEGALPLLLIGGSLSSSPPQPPAGNDAPTGFLRDIRGFHAAVLYDGHRTIVAADRHASLPLYYAISNGQLLFAPEPKALLCDPRVSRAEDTGALANLLVAGFLCGDQTLLRDVRRLRGGHALIVENGSLRVEQYWRYRPAAEAGSKTWRELIETMGDLVEAAVARNLGDPAKSVLFLSGGFDSRAILGGARKAMGGDVRQLQTVSWGQDRGPEDSDVATASNLAAALGLKHHFIQRRTEDYEARFREVAELVDGQSEIAAFHPHEYAIMRELRSQGFERVLRGDECFGYSYHVTSHTGALAVVWLHRLRDALNGRDFLRPELVDDWCNASDAAIDAVLAEIVDLAPDDAKDFCYFSHRLQGYLNTASYYKRCIFDQRNVLLDETFLDLMEHVPAKWRIDKALFCAAMRQRFPDLYRLPMARRHNLEDWADLLRKESPVRTFALKQVADRDSGVWQWFNREACVRFLTEPARTDGPSLRAGMKSLLRNTFLRLPKWMQAPVQAWKASRPAYRLAPEYVLLRILVLKDWHDRLLK